MTNCCFCDSPMNWNSDFHFEDYGIEGNGVVAVLTCTNEDCKATAEFHTKIEDEEE